MQDAIMRRLARVKREIAQPQPIRIKSVGEERPDNSAPLRVREPGKSAPDGRAEPAANQPDGKPPLDPTANRSLAAIARRKAYHHHVPDITMANAKPEEEMDPRKLPLSKPPSPAPKSARQAG